MPNWEDDEVGKYAVGRGAPPKHTQFKKGRSGNPKGRPKDKGNYSRLLEKELSSPVLIQEGGKTRKISKREAVAKRMVIKALQGDPRAINTIMILDERSGSESNASNPTRDLDIEIIRRFAPRILAEVEAEAIEPKQ